MVLTNFQLNEETKTTVGYTVGGAIVGFVLYESPAKNVFQHPNLIKSIAVCGGLGFAFALGYTESKNL